ncbi:threonylcarbamoyl-AMP synthase [Bradymonadaceae bacterium TMQ3]|uniref:L-threonylcarbamoyladenylate synthase n=1 Tax=Lujinxingia sediminis TaxID=2480984 RepID=A0ABY0CXH5_9DELT|nr:L-threonylcarbamoyladenylate synthase [Lujinxingia sediminis]RDV39815.1 threonylcarbamoyl-AMP synthase [Bradymonadaceae bacterium TMQ3]RVU48140.1 threonylcarbamoyl-AMP synthase [Lujinxingia sediminis]TXC77440.1 threonylcarbamoyl-AMP synthase [Bradymonadales bacterium TMQ1]
MHIIKLESDAAVTAEAINESVRVLEQGGLVCLPCKGTYRILADLKNEDAVMRVFQSKRRVHKAPCLVFIDTSKRLHEVARDVDPAASALMKAIWPGELTLLFEASDELPRGVVKQLTKANGKIGVRVPESNLVRQVVERFAGPVLVSSANRGNKSGESSPAQVRKNFVGRVDLFVDAGDLPQAPGSTVVDITDEEVVIVRQGTVPRARIEEVIEALDEDLDE